MQPTRRLVLGALLVGAACLPAAGGDEEGVSASGVVRDVKGAGVAHVPVIWKLTPQGDDGRTLRQWQNVLTDGGGRYEIPGLAPGTFEIGVGGELNNYLEPDLNLKERIGDASVRHDFVLEGSLGFGGRVDLAGDAPITVQVLRRGEGSGGGWVGGAAGRRVTLGAERSFAFAALCPGVYDVHVHGDGFVPIHRVVEFTRDVRDFTAAPQRGGVVTGRVVRTPGIEKSYVDVRLMLGGDPPWRMPVDGVEKDGTFTFANVPPGRWRITADVSRQLTGDGDCRNLNGEAWVVVPDPPGKVEAPPIDWVRDEDVGLHVALPPGATAAEGKVTLLGPGRGPWDWQRFIASRRKSGTATGRNGMSPILGFASPAPFLRDDGSLRLFDVAAGALRIRVEVFGYETEEREVEVRGPTTIEIPLRRAKGRLVAAPDMHGNGIDYFVIEARSAGSDDPWRAILHGDERARISDMPPPEGRVALLAPGDWEFRMTSDRYALATLGPLTIEDGVAAPLHLDFRFSDGHSISGSLRTREGGRVAERLLRVFRVENGKAVAMPECLPFAGSDGYRIEGLTPGRYRIALTDGGADPLAEVDISDADVALDLVLCR